MIRTKLLLAILTILVSMMLPGLTVHGKKEKQILEQQQTSSVPDSTYHQNFLRAQAVALSESERPKLFMISDYIRGPVEGLSDPVNPQVLDESLQTMTYLGSNTAGVIDFGNQTSRVNARAGGFGISRFRHAVSAPYGPGYFTFQTRYFNAASVENWARTEAQNVQSWCGIPPSQVALFHMADEPGWYYPDILNVLKGDKTGLDMFRSYLRDGGFNPSDFGVVDWGKVLPIGQSSAINLPSRKLFFQTIRFVSESVADALHQEREAAKRHFSAGVLTTSNYNALPNKFYVPSPNQRIYNSPSSGPDTAFSSLNIMDMARHKSVGLLWTEDWFQDVFSQSWSVYASVLRSAARLGQLEFGGYIMGRTLGANTSGARLKALTLLGNGAKTLEWYVNGPEERFPGNGYSNNPYAYAQIASANRLIAKAEDLLYPGRPGVSQVAFLMPSTAQFWDVKEQGVDPSLSMLYMDDLTGAQYAYDHCQYPVDYLDDQTIATEGLLNYKVLYVTTPNLSADAQAKLDLWISNGGVAVFAPGAGAADEYNTPTARLDAARGIQSRPIPRKAYNQETSPYHYVTYGSVPLRDNIYAGTPGSTETVIRQLEPLQLTNAQRIATFEDGSTAIACNAYGQGLTISLGFWAGQRYMDTPNQPHTIVPVGWSEPLRTLLTSAAKLAGVEKRVEVDRDLVQALRLDSPLGTAVTLLNWTDQPIGDLSILVRKTGPVNRVEMAEGGAVQYSVEGDGIRVIVPLVDADVLKIYWGRTKKISR